MSSKFENVTDNISLDLFTPVEFSDEQAERTGYSNYSYWMSTWKVFIKNKGSLAILIFLGTLLAFTIIQPYLPGQYGPTEIVKDPVTNEILANYPPGEEFWFGSNNIGQDLWARVWSGTRTSLLIGVMVGLWDAVVGIIIGGLWGYVRQLDRIITEIYNVFNNIPSTILLVLLTFIMRPGIFTLVVAMGATGWLPMARFVRNQIVIIRDREYNLASRCLGTSFWRMVTKNLLPFLVSVIMLRVALAIPGAIGREVFLSYIGLGLPLEIPSLGNLIVEGRVTMMNPNYRYQLIFPSVVLSSITISFYVLGNAFADSADPRNHV